MYATQNGSGVMGMSKRHDETSGVRPWVKKIFEYSDLISSLYAAVVAAGMLCFLGIIVLALVPSWSEAESFSVTIRNFALIIGGVVGFVFAFRRLAQTDEQIEISDTEAKTRLRDEDRKDREEVDKSFDRAVEALNGNDISISLYGASRMKQLAIDHADDYLEIAIRLIGNRARWTARGNGLEIEKVEDRETILALRAYSGEFAQIVLPLAELFEKDGKRKNPLDLRGLNLTGFQFAGITLVEGMISGCALDYAHFERCTFLGGFGAKLGMSSSTFRSCYFIRNEWYENAGTFDGAKFYGCEFEETSFDSCDFSGAEFHGNTMKPDYLEMIFNNSNFTKAKFIFNSDSTEWTEKGLRGFYCPGDFQQCFVDDQDSYPTGLQDNLPPLDVEIQRVPSPHLPEGKVGFNVVSASFSLHND